MLQDDHKYSASERELQPRRLKKWRVAAGTVFAAPIVVDQFIIVTNIEHGAMRNYGFLRAFDSLSGTPCWMFSGEGGMGIRGGITTTPAVANGKVLFGSGEGRFYGIDLASGRPTWDFSIDRPILSSPKVKDDVVFFASDDSNAYALQVGSGKLKWKYAVGARVQAPLVVDETAVYIVDTNGTAHVLSTSGALLWRKAIANLGPASIATSGELLLILDTKTGELQALSLLDRIDRWRFQFGGRAATILPTSFGIVCLGGDERVMAIDLVTGNPIWARELGGGLTAPLVVGRTVVIAGHDGRIYAIDLVKGTELWVWEASERLQSEIASQKGILYLVTGNGDLVAIE